MYVLIAYDVNTTTKEGARRLSKVAKHCQNYGQRVQNSLFECLIDYGSFLKFKQELLKLIDMKTDSIRFYYLGNKWDKKIEHIGAKENYKIDDTLIL